MRRALMVPTQRTPRPRWRNAGCHGRGSCNRRDAADAVSPARREPTPQVVHGIIEVHRRAHPFYYPPGWSNSHEPDQ
jgi:hypothetical protein